MQGNYKILPFASMVFKVLAWIGLALGILSAVIIFSGMDENAPRWSGVIMLVAGAVYFFVLFVIAEVVKLLLDINDRIK